MTQVFIFHIDFHFTVAIVTENGREKWAKIEKKLFWTKIGSFTDSVFKDYISAQLNTKKILKYFYVFCYHLSFI